MPHAPDFASKPTLTGERVILRPYLDADLPALREAMADLDVLRLTGSVHSVDRCPAATRTTIHYLPRRGGKGSVAVREYRCGVKCCYPLPID